MYTFNGHMKGVLLLDKIIMFSKLHDMLLYVVVYAHTNRFICILTGQIIYNKNIILDNKVQKCDIFRFPYDMGEFIITAKLFCTLHKWNGWAHKPGLTHLSLVHSSEPSVVLCVHYQ